jgi:hypothetical protein
LISPSSGQSTKRYPAWLDYAEDVDSKIFPQHQIPEELYPQQQRYEYLKSGMN